MVYFNAPALQSLLVEMGLDSSVQYQSGDLLYWVDSNIGFNKVDVVILRKMIYEVDMTDLDHPKAHLTMEYEHPIPVEIPCVHEATYGKEIAYTNMFQRCYWDYWRVYTAPSTQLMKANVQFIPGDFLLSGNDWRIKLDLESDLPGTGMVAGLQVIPTNSSSKIELYFDLSPEILTYQSGIIGYELTIHKQFGLKEIPIEFVLKIPEQYQFIYSMNKEDIFHNSLKKNSILNRNNLKISASFQIIN